MSFYIGSIYMLVDAQNKWSLFVAGSPNDTNKSYLTPVGTLYYPGSDLKSRQSLNAQPMALQYPPILVLHLVNLLSGPHFKSVSILDNHIDKIVSGGDSGLPPKNDSYWWFDILFRLHSMGVVNVDAATLAQRIRTETATAFANYQKTRKCTIVNL